MCFSFLTSSAGPSLHTAKDSLPILPHPCYAYLGSPSDGIRQCDRSREAAQGPLISTLLHEASVLVQEASASFIPRIWGSVQGPQPSRTDCEQESLKSHEWLSWKEQLESISTSSEESKPAAPHRAGLRPSRWSPQLPKNLSASEPAYFCRGEMTTLHTDSCYHKPGSVHYLTKSTWHTWTEVPLFPSPSDKGANQDKEQWTDSLKSHRTEV